MGQNMNLTLLIGICDFTKQLSEFYNGKMGLKYHIFILASVLYDFTRLSKEQLYI